MNITVLGGGLVGSAIVNQIATHGRSPELVPRVTQFVAEMVQAVKGR